ncbi:hypothetical protein C8J56DRAFT_911885 [Mycena floridula]|nr:hypothetical protein C8J56DRAFT_911885 [Mycena floridula]
MDQESFRRLLQESASAPKLAAASSKPKKTINASEPAFKPRKVTKSDKKYRDRAAERRDGQDNEYAEVEAVLDDFEKRTANQDKASVELQRQYLGGDGEHSILVKGLDTALAKQNKARAAQSTDDDDSLEQAFQEAGKFRPIGFKPIGDDKKKKKGDGEKKKKKKRKPQEAEAAPVNDEPVVAEPEPQSSVPVEDFDIFEGAGEYEGVNLDDDEGEGSDTGTRPLEPTEQPVASSSKPGRWFLDDEPEPPPPLPAPSSNSKPPPTKEDEDEEEELPMRLVPLASSALPSIKELLALDKAAGSSNKKRKRKDKPKGEKDEEATKPKVSAEVKAERDYKRLKSYTDKKAAAK